MLPTLVLLAGVMSGAVQPQPAVPSTIPEMWDAWCARCHAPDGSGRVAEPTISVEPMDFTDCAVATPEPDADWEIAIAAGGPAVGLSAEMPAFGDALTTEQIRGFVRHIRGMCRESGWPLGNLNFPLPIFTEKAYPENEFVLKPRLSRRDGRSDLEFVSVYERRLGRRGMWEVAVPLASHAADDGGARAHGLGDVDIAVKYVLAAGAEGAGILSGGLEVALPTGRDSRGLGHGTAVFEPYLAAGTMIGDVYVQAQLKGELSADRAKAARAVVYNMYLGRDTAVTPDTWTIGIELNGENRELAVTPQIRKGLTRTGALGAAFGVRIPLNRREEQGTRWVGYLLWEYLEPVLPRR
ncbi:MAG: hypothetical protein AB1635_18365 [Acidobacteriota bacterium]